MPSDTGDALTRQSIRLALALYAIAGLLMLCLDLQGWSAATVAGKVARWAWSAAVIVYLVHVALAFHHYHHWSHAEAVAHVEARSGFGPGIAFSHLFSLAWSADVIFWWLAPARYARRPRWVGGLLHGYMAFMIFNATVVYETGTIRLAGILLTLLLGSALVFRRVSLPFGADGDVPGP